MDYIFCFAGPQLAASATVERKKIDRGIQVTCKWETPGSPTITYEARVDFNGEVRYRVKFNRLIWAGFGGADRELVAEFNQALHELGDAQMRKDTDDSATEETAARTSAVSFFRSDKLAS